MILTTDFWDGVINDERIDRFPDWESINRSISRLDEKTYTLIVLDDEKGSSLFVGGGASGSIVAFSLGQDHLIARQGDETKTISVVVGGQAGDYRKRIDMTGDAEFEANIGARLQDNGLGWGGTDTLRITGAGPNASSLQ